MKHLITSLTLFWATASLAVTDTLYVQTSNGIGQRKAITILIYRPDDIKATTGYEDYVKSLSGMESDTTYKDFIRQVVRVNLITLSYKIKNSASLDFPDGATGSAISTDDRKLFVKFPFYTQNGYGQRVISNAMIMGDQLFIKN